MKQVIRIMVLCASGMSSGLIVDSIKEHAADFGVETVIQCSPSLRYRQLDYSDLDIILIAPQIKSQTRDIMAYVADQNVDIPYLNIQMKEYGLVKGREILGQALAVLEEWEKNGGSQGGQR